MLRRFPEQLVRTAELLHAPPDVSHESADAKLRLLSKVADGLGFASTLYGRDLLCVQAGSGSDVLTVVHHYDVLPESVEESAETRFSTHYPTQPPAHGSAHRPAHGSARGGDFTSSSASSSLAGAALRGSLVTYHAAPALSLLYALKAAVTEADSRAGAAIRILFGVDGEAGSLCFSGTARRRLFDDACILVNSAFSGAEGVLPGWLDVVVRIPVQSAGDAPIQTPHHVSDRMYTLKWETSGERSDLVPDLAIASLYPEPLTEGKVLRDMEGVIAARDLPIAVTPYPQRDRLGLRIVARGRRGHASDPSRADNALYHMAQLCSQLPVYGRRAFQWIAETFDARGQYRERRRDDPVWSIGQVAMDADWVDLHCAARLSWEIDPTVILDDLRRRLPDGGSAQPKRMLRGRKDALANRLLRGINAALIADEDSSWQHRVDGGRAPGGERGAGDGRLPDGERGPLTRFPDYVRGISFGPVLTGQEDHAYEAGECVYEEDVLAATHRYARLFATWLANEESDR